ncbi:MAG: hypothetical protein WCX95_03050 [Candidatus Gracilibacteria bacterium]
MKTASFAGNHQVVVFWLGVLTGALVVGFAFFYGMLRMQQYQTAIYKSNLLRPTSYSTTLTKTTLTTPTTSIVAPLNTRATGGDGTGY